MSDQAITVVVGGEGLGFSWRVSTEDETFGFGWKISEDEARVRAEEVREEAKEILARRKEEAK